MRNFNITERIQRVKKYFRRTSKEEVMLLINQAIKELGEIERKTDEIWAYVIDMSKKRDRKIYVELIGEELDRIVEEVETIKEILNKAKENIHLSQRKEYEIDLWI
ncbi:hypothetical protein [Candidatus Kryptobacter tengchongensis]|uniref:Uncharacterized protein n=1 Tax=Kryptobacter tengchongensis TaxID=1643429 RepID=A0A656D3J1_KRYT1|nr:hypothetical protein [Candidatus Kryptobacter tengchongensis]CUS98507.1 hypothetical protein JGI24_00460 [Candidatus Kryptobacter tengchongensis]